MNTNISNVRTNSFPGLSTNSKGKAPSSEAPVVMFTPENHARLLATVVAAQQHYSSSAVHPEAAFNEVGRQIIKSEKKSARHDIQKAKEDSLLMGNVMNRIKSSKNHNSLEAANRLQSAFHGSLGLAEDSDRAVQEATDQKSVQYHTKLTALHVAHAKLAFAQLRQLDPQEVGATSNLTTAQENYSKAFHQAKSLISTPPPESERENNPSSQLPPLDNRPVATDRHVESGGALISDDGAEGSGEVRDDQNGIWRDVDPDSVWRNVHPRSVWRGVKNEYSGKEWKSKAVE